MASSSITSWQIDGETMETVTDYFLGSKITADGDCSHEIKRRLLLGWKVTTNLDSILKSRDITLPTKIHLVKAMVFPVVRYGCESWTIRKAERQRTDAFELWFWRRFWRVPRTARRSNRSILKEINPEYSLEGLMLKLKLQYSGHQMQRADSLEYILMLRKIKGKRIRWLDSILDSMDTNLSKFWIVVLEKTLESPLDCQEIQLVHPKGNQSWVFTGGTDVEAETPILWPPDVESWLIWRDPDAGKDWGQEEKGMTDDEMVGWHHQLDGHEFE